MVKTGRLLAKTALREVTKNWKQFLSMLLIGTIAVTLFVGLVANAESLEQRVEETYERGNMADIWVTTSGIDLGESGDVNTDLNNLKEICGGTVESRFYYTVTIEGKNAYLVTPITESTDVKPTVSIPWELDEEGQYSFDSGSYFLVDQSLTTDSVAGEAVVHVGEEASISVVLPASEAITKLAGVLDNYLKEGASNPLYGNEVTFKGTVTGTMRYPENINVASYNRSAFLVSPSYMLGMLLQFFYDYYEIDQSNWEQFLADLIEAFSGSSTSSTILPIPMQYVVKLPDGVGTSEAIDKIDAYFAAKSESNLVIAADRSLMPFSSSIQNEMGNARNLTYVFPVVFFLVAILVILTTTSQIILKDRTKIGSMRAIGLSKAQVYGHYMSIVGGVVLLGTIIGIIVGPFLLPSVMARKYDILYTLVERSLFVFPVWAALGTALGFLLIASLVTYLVSRKTVNLPPSVSMRPERPKVRANKKLKIETKTPSARFLSLKIAVRNMRTNLVKSVMVVIGVMGCTALLVCGFGVDNTIDYGVANDVGIFYNSDLELTYVVGQDDATLNSSLVEHYDMVEAAVGVNRTAVDVYVGEEAGKETILYTLSEEHRFGVPFEEGIFLSRYASDELGAGTGDTVRFTYMSRTYSGEVKGVFRSFSSNGIFVTASFLGDLTATYTQAFVYLKDGVSQQAAKEQLLGDGIASLSGIMTHDERETQIADTVSGIAVITTAIKVFAILLALVVLYNLALLTFRERTRDIATLKVLGFSKSEIASSLLLESMSLTTLGIGLGLAVGFPFMQLCLVVNRIPYVDFLYYVSPWTYVFSFLLTFLVALLVNFVLSQMTGRVKMVESLKSVE